MGVKVFYKCGFKKRDLIPVKCKMSAANKEQLTLFGAVFVRLSGSLEETRNVKTGALVYVSPDTDKFYLSREVLKDLKIIDENFPKIQVNSIAAPLAERNGREINEAACGCKIRTLPPPKPTSLPFECNESNIPRMRQWLLDRYASSTFNKCTHQQLPLMEGPPVVTAQTQPQPQPPHNKKLGETR